MPLTSASRFFFRGSSVSTAKASPIPYKGRRNRIMPQSNNCLSGLAQCKRSQYSEITSDRTLFCNSANCCKELIVKQLELLQSEAAVNNIKKVVAMKMLIESLFNNHIPMTNSARLYVESYFSCFHLYGMHSLGNAGQRKQKSTGLSVWLPFGFSILQQMESFNQMLTFLKCNSLIQLQLKNRNCIHSVYVNSTRSFQLEFINKIFIDKLVLGHQPIIFLPPIVMISFNQL